MSKWKEKHRGISICLKILALLLCTIVGTYGIVTAPESDQAKLEQELKQNEQALREMDRTTSDSEPGDNAKTPQMQETKKTEQTISVIGDSVFLGAAPSYKQLQTNAVIDAKISRQVRQGLDVAKKLKKRGKLGNTVLIALGTNGIFNEATGQELIDYLGTNRTIYWINAYGKDLAWQKEVNQTIQTLAKKNDNVHVIAWATEAKKHPHWFYQDGTHLNTKGQKGFARFIQKEVRLKP